MADTLLVDGTDIKTLVPNGVTVTSLDYFAPAKRRGDNDTIPGRAGQVGHAKPLDAYSFSVGLLVRPTTGTTVNTKRASMVANLRAFIKACSAGSGVVTLQRKLMNAESTVLTTTCLGEFVGTNAFELMNYQTGKTECEFINLRGSWVDTATTSTGNFSTATGFTIAGDFNTRAMTITLPGPGTLTNSTTGVTLSVTQACILDVENFTATPSSALAGLTSTGSDAWFELLPKANTLSWVGVGVASIAYKAEWI